MDNVAEDIVRSDGLFLDSNLLLIAMIGNHFGKLEVCKRLAAYTWDDYVYVNAFIEMAKVVYVTPNIVTEVSNLSTVLPTTLKRDYYQFLVTWVADHCEVYVPTAQANSVDAIRLGITDALIIAGIVDKQLTYITADLDLYIELLKNGKNAYNYTHLR